MENRENIEKDFPNTVYKYRDWRKSLHRKWLKECQVYMASPLEFEDEKECQYEEYKYITLGDYYLYHFNYSKKYNLHFSTEKEHCDYATFWARTKIDASKANRNFGILSLTDRFDYPKLWEVHGGNHTGICIAYNRQKLLNKIKGANLWVDYVSNMPIYDGRSDDLETEIRKKFCSKYKDDFEWENELRMVKIYPDKETHPNRKISIPEEYIEAVYLGAKMPEKTKRKITELVREKYGFEPIDLSKECSKNIFL